MILISHFNDLILMIIECVAHYIPFELLEPFGFYSASFSGLRSGMTVSGACGVYTVRKLMLLSLRKYYA